MAAGTPQGLPASPYGHNGYNGYQGVPQWDTDDALWVHNCTQDDDFSGSFGAIGSVCEEAEDANGHTCGQYIANGYRCVDMVTFFHYDCHCTCD